MLRILHQDTPSPAPFAPERQPSAFPVVERQCAPGPVAVGQPTSDTPRICVIIPFFNEEVFIEKTLASLAAQTLPPASIVLIDNGSTDRSASICRSFAEANREIPVKLLRDERPGKIHALETGCRFINAEFAAFCDADTIYPKHYLETAARLFRRNPNDIVAVMALGVDGDSGYFRAAAARLKGSVAASLLSKQCHAGGFGQVFRTSSLLKAGGYSAAHWPYVLEDHELMHRMLKLGRSLYHPKLWCRPSPRRTNRSNASWNIVERILYHCTPFRWKDWYFYRFLGPRFARRGLQNLALRNRSWEVG